MPRFWVALLIRVIAICPLLVCSLLKIPKLNKLSTCQTEAGFLISTNFASRTALFTPSRGRAMSLRRGHRLSNIDSPQQKKARSLGMTQAQAVLIGRNFINCYIVAARSRTRDFKIIIVNTIFLNTEKRSINFFWPVEFWFFGGVGGWNDPVIWRCWGNFGS